MASFPRFLIDQFEDVSGTFRELEWMEWRYSYYGGKLFRDKFLQKFSDRETDAEFERRKLLTPIPTYAKKEINRVRNSLSSRLPDVTRKGGSKKWRDAMAGVGKGVDLRGSSMNAFTSKIIIPEMLVMQQFGVLVDAPRFDGGRRSDEPANFRPFLRPFKVENYKAVEAPAEHVSDWLAVTLRMTRKNREGKIEVFYRSYWIDDSGEAVAQDTTDSGKELSPVRRLGREDIPFVEYDGGESLMAEAHTYQVAALNLISADSSYAVDSNFTFLTRHVDDDPANHLNGGNIAKAGVTKGLLFENERPEFISPPTGPIQVSMELRKMMKEEVREIVTGILMAAGDDGTLDAGLAFYGSRLQDGEQRIQDFWASYGAMPATTVAYPETWSLKTDQERIDEANAWVDLMNKLPGDEGRKEASKEAYDRAFKGKLPTAKLDAIKSQVESLEFTSADPDTIIKALEKGAIPVRVAAEALGFDPKVAEEAKKDADQKAARSLAAAMDANGGARQGVPELSADPNSVSEARKIEPKRGEGQFNQGDE